MNLFEVTTLCGASNIPGSVQGECTKLEAYGPLEKEMTFLLFVWRCGGVNLTKKAPRCFIIIRSLGPSCSKHKYLVNKDIAGKATVCFPTRSQGPSRSNHSSYFRVYQRINDYSSVLLDSKDEVEKIERGKNEC